MRVLAAALLLAAAGAARASAEVDFTDEQFEKVAAKVLFNQVKVNTRFNPQIYDRGPEYYAEKFRLMPGRILLCGIDGEPSAYIYLGYFGEGKTPTVEDVVAKSVSHHDEIWDYLSTMSYDPQGYKHFFESTFPEYIYTSSTILGVNAVDAAYFESRCEIPHIIQNQKTAEDRAKGYFRSEEIVLVRYLWSLRSEINGYEFTDGKSNIIVPFDIDSKRFPEDKVYTREEIDLDIDSHILDVDPREGESYKKLMAAELESTENNRADSDEDVLLPGGKAATASAAAGGAVGIDYEYPPEYAELFARFRAITPEEAVKMVSVMGYTIGEGSAGSVILEPMVIKATDGLPGSYWILAQKTNDAELRGIVERFISMANAENGFDPYEFVKKCEVLKEHSSDFCSFYIDAWTWTGEIGSHSGSLAVLIIEAFPYYLNRAEDLYGEGNLVRAWFYAASIRNPAPVVIFETRDGAKHYLYGSRYDPEEIDYERVQELAAAGMEEAYTHFKEHPDAWSAAESRWTETHERIESDAIKENGYYKLRGPNLDDEMDEDKDRR